MNYFKEFKVWQKAIELVTETYSEYDNQITKYNRHKVTVYNIQQYNILKI